MEARAIAKNVRTSAKKMKPINDLIRGKSVEEAQIILRFTTRKGAKLLLKVLNSAAANAENNNHMEFENLYVSEVYANQGPTMKRFRAGAMGRAKPILKRTSHLGVVVKERN
jgi:large subunit ribosomal protein L22